MRSGAATGRMVSARVPMAPAGIVLGAASLALAAGVLAGRGAAASAPVRVSVSPDVASSPVSPDVASSLTSSSSASPSSSTEAAEVAVPPELRPLLELYCVACHEGARAKGGFELASVLEAGRCDESVLRALRKRLAKRDMPPADEPERPDDDAYRAAVAAIDAVVPPLAREVPAVRRLNRAQYAGAVRDVLGVSVDEVAALLPRDEIGEGFDTTASTLALPPLLIEKYFDAAERIAEQCVPPESWSQRRVIAPEKLERKGQGGTYDGIAWLATAGTLSARFEATHAGRYRVTLEAAGQLAGDENPRLVATAGGLPLASIAVAAPASAPQLVMGEVELPRGTHAVVARFTNDFWDPKAADPARRDRNLGIGRVVVEGPLGATGDTPFELRARGIAGEGADIMRLRRVAASVGEELFRRALAKGESDALAATAREAVGVGASGVGNSGVKAPFDAQLRALVTALLVDPRFLLRIEATPADAPGNARHPLPSDELASRLAFFLWSSVPDAELRRAARTGELASDDALRAQVRRMLADPRATSLAQRFAAQWLGIDGLESRQVDPQLFPGVDAALLASMRRETELLFEEVVRGARPVRALLESRVTRVDARLAAHYGIPAPSADAEWFEHAVAPARGAGVLGHAGILLATSNPTRTSPVKRGKWVMQALLDDAPPPPPPGVPQRPERPEDTRGMSVRELMALHRANPDCASCHVRMDAIGLAFESSGVDGRLRDGVEDSSELPDGSVLRGIRGVEELLAGNRAFERSLARHLLVYALGRGTADADGPLVDRLADGLAAHGDFASLVDGIVLSEAFRTRVSAAKAGK